MSTLTILIFRAGGVEGWVECIEVLCVKLLLNASECFTEALEVHNFPGTQETNRIGNLRILDKTQDVVVRDACLLLRRQIFKQIRSRVAG